MLFLFDTARRPCSVGLCVYFACLLNSATKCHHNYIRFIGHWIHKSKNRFLWARVFFPLNRGNSTHACAESKWASECCWYGFRAKSNHKWWCSCAIFIIRWNGSFSWQTFNSYSHSNKIMTWKIIAKNSMNCLKWFSHTTIGHTRRT